jgi:predicted PurR-regulated permease PerM
MTPERARWYRIALVVVTVSLLGVLVWQARDSLTPFVVGGILAYLLLPLVRRVERLWPERGRWRSIRRPLAIVLVYLAVIVTVIVTVTLVVGPLSRQLGDIVDRTPMLIQQARDRTQVWLDQYHAIVPDEYELAIETNLAQVGAAIVTGLRTALAGAAGWLLRTVNVIIGLLIIPLWLFYVMKDERAGARFFYSLFHPSVVGDVHAIVGIVNKVLGRYIRGQLFLGLVIGVSSFIGLSLIGLPYALVLAVINGLFELIPIIGPWLGAIPAIIVTLALAPDKIGLVILFYILLQQVENTLLVPKIQGDAVEINPALLIIALAIGGDVAGVWGLLAAVPLAAIGRDIVAYLYRRFSPPDSPAAWAGGEVDQPSGQSEGQA